MLRSLFAWIFLCLSCQASTLDIGGAAPATRPEIQIQGDAVGKFETGRLYVFECWATWCGPCVATIPHLNALHQKLGPKGIIITGVNVWDGEKSEEAEKNVREFVKKQGKKMSYPVAIGGKEFIKTWLEASNTESIPVAFVVNGNGVLVWTGHPAELNETLLGDLLTGTVAPKPQATAAKPVTEWYEAMKKGNWDKVESLLPEVLKKLPPDIRAGFQKNAEANIALGRGDPTLFYTVLEERASEESTNPEVQNEVAWQLLTDARFEGKVNFALAEKCATAAVQLTDSKHADKLDTLARLRFMQGKQAEAIELQEKAVGLADYLTLKDELKATLESLRQGKLPPVEPPAEAH